MREGWFLGLIERAREVSGQEEVCGILDCGARAGDVMAGLRAGLRFFCFSGRESIRDRLRQIEAEATIFSRRGRCVEVPLCR